MSFKDLTDSRSLSACIRYLPYAETLGARCFGARLSGLHVVPIRDVAPLQARRCGAHSHALSGKRPRGHCARRSQKIVLIGEISTIDRSHIELRLFAPSAAKA